MRVGGLPDIGHSLSDRTGLSQAGGPFRGDNPWSVPVENTGWGWDKRCPIGQVCPRGEGAATGSSKELEKICRQEYSPTLTVASGVKTGAFSSPTH